MKNAIIGGILVALILLLLGVHVSAQEPEARNKVPVIKGVIYLMQPDGTVIALEHRGGLFYSYKACQDKAAIHGPDLMKQTGSIAWVAVCEAVGEDA